jgi:hypothetical protein
MQKKIKLQYLLNHRSDLSEILESGPEFCRDHAKRDGANQSECKSSNERLRDCLTFFEIKNVGTLTYGYSKARS